jgi:hypothetical protein
MRPPKHEASRHEASQLEAAIVVGIDGTATPNGPAKSAEVPVENIMRPSLEAARGVCASSTLSCNTFGLGLSLANGCNLQGERLVPRLATRLCRYVLRARKSWITSVLRLVILLFFGARGGWVRNFEP